MRALRTLWKRLMLRILSAMTHLFLACPASKHAWPSVAACWSPIAPAIGRPAFQHPIARDEAQNHACLIFTYKKLQFVVARLRHVQGNEGYPVGGE